jgi:hypothetical protein
MTCQVQVEVATYGESVVLVHHSLGLLTRTGGRRLAQNNKETHRDHTRLSNIEIVTVLAATSIRRVLREARYRHHAYQYECEYRYTSTYSDMYLGGGHDELLVDDDGGGGGGGGTLQLALHLLQLQDTHTHTRVRLASLCLCESHFVYMRVLRFPVALAWGYRTATRLYM